MRNKHPLAGQTVKVKKGTLEGQDFTVEDWWENVFGKSWMDSTGNPAALEYSYRAANEKLPLDWEVLYGKIEGLGCLIHMSELQ